MEYNDTENPRPFAIMSLGDHLQELRKRLINSIIGAAIAITVCLFFTNKIIAYLEKPYIDTMKAAGLEPHLMTLTPADGFFSYFKIGAWMGLFIASPWIFYQLWKFVSAGLYPREKRYVHIAAPISAVLFVGGAYFCMLTAAPLTIKFFVIFNKEMLGLESSFTFTSYISFMISMIAGFGLSFQLPVLMFFLNKFGILPLSFITKSRRYVIFFVVVLAAFMTPELISFFVLSILLYMLFECGVIAIRLAGRERSQQKLNS